MSTEPTPSPEDPVGSVKTRTFWSVVACLFFFPTGAAALFQSGKVYSSNQAGRPDLAEQANKKVKLWQNITGLIIILYLVVWVIVAFLTNNT